MVDCLASAQQRVKRLCEENEELRTKMQQATEDTAKAKGTVDALRASAKPVLLQHDDGAAKQATTPEHSNRFMTDLMPVIGQYGRVIAPPPGDGMKQRHPEFFNSLMAAGKDMRGMDIVK